MAFRRLHHVIQHLRSTASAAFATDRHSRRTRRGGGPKRAEDRALEYGLGLYGIEQLESRTLLTTVSGFTNDVFEYRDEFDQIQRVKLSGNIIAELIGAQVDRRLNQITLVNLPGELDGDPVFGGFTRPALDDIGPIFIPTNFGQAGTIQALTAGQDGTVYAINTIVEPFQTRHQIVELTIPQPPNPGGPDGTVIGVVLLTEITVPSTSLAGNQPRTITGADVSPDGRIFFVGASAQPGSLGAWSVDPNAADVGGSLGFFGRVGIPSGPDLDSVPSIPSIVATSNGTLVGVVTGANDVAESQLVDISLADPANIGNNDIFPIIDAISGNAVPAIVGLEEDIVTGQLIGIQGGIDNAAVYQIFNQGFQRGLAFNYGPVNPGGAFSSVTSLAFAPGLQDPFTGDTRGSYLAVNGGRLVYVDASDRLPAQWLYAVYVSQSDLTGQMTMGYVRNFDPNPPPDPFVIRAFEGDVGPIRVQHAQSGNSILVSPDAETGRLFLGARTQNINPNTDLEERIPFENADVPSDIDFGVLPDNISSLRPGLIVAPGQDLGKFLVGGTFTGAVDAAGSIDLFYAGWLLTGSVTGQFEGPIERADNFNVAGDLRNLLVLDSIGTDGPGVDTGEPQYITGFDLRVGGTLGEIGSGSGGLQPLDDLEVDPVASGSAIAGSIEVNHLPNAPRIERNQFEAEYHALAGAFTNLTDGFEEFNFVGANGNDRVSFNDTYNTAEYLGSIASGALGRSEVVNLSGVLQQSPLYEDPSDYYAVALMAGQRYIARVVGLGPPINIGVFDPDGRLIATDYNDSAPAQTLNEFFAFTPDRPGIYRFGIAANGDAPTFNGALRYTIDIPYTFTLLGMGDVAVGGIVADGAILDIFDPFQFDPGIEVFVGDLGAVKSHGGRFLSDNSDTMVVERGNLRVVDAFDLGLAPPAGTIGVSVSAPTIDIPQGNVGLIRAGTFVVPFDQDPAAQQPDDAIPAATRILAFNLLNTRPIGGSFQVIDGDEANVLVDLFADGGIGVIRAATMEAGASTLTVNADDRGEDGIIDLIDCFGDLGNIADGGPQITTNTGGNVRYIRCLGTVYKDVFFGIGEPDEILITPGEAIDVVDDSGAVLNMRTIGDVRRNPLFNPQFPQSGLDPFIGPSALITPYGIRDAGGAALVNITSEGGLDVEVKGGNFAEIGRIEVRGIGIEVLNGADVRDADSPLGSREVFVAAAGTVVPPDDQQQVDPDDTDGDPDFEPGDRRVRPQDLSVLIHGSGRVDVLNIVVADRGDDTDSDEDGEFDTADVDEDGNTTELADSEGDGFPDDTGNSNEIRASDGFYLGELTEEIPIVLGNAVEIINSTPRGEIVNVLAESVVTLAANGSLGMGRNHTGADIVGNEIVHLGSDLRGTAGGRRPREVQTANARTVGSFGYFLGETNAIVIAGGNINTIRAGEAIGNLVIQGSVSDITADADNNDIPGLFEGINGVVSTYGFANVDQPAETGRIFNVNIGEGLLPSGTGNFARAGIFGYNSIGRVFGNEADIRGDIQSLNGVTTPIQNIETPRFQATDDSAGSTTVAINRPKGIESVRLENGSIINADIMVTTNRDDTEEFDNTGLAIPGLQDPINFPIFELVSVIVNGNGGIIGSNFFGPDINRIAAGGGTFGIFQSNIDGLSDDRVNIVEGGGYGIRNVAIDPGGSLGSLIANGDGTNLSTNAISASVRYSEQAISDPLVGVIDPFFGFAPNRLTDIHAFLGTSAAQPEISGVTDTGIIEGTSAVGTRDLGTVRAWQIRGGSSLDFVNSFNRLEVRDIINGLEITTGTLRNFKLNRDAFALSVNVTGRIKKIDIRGSLAGGSVIRTKGDGGRFDSVNVSGNLIGNINSSRAIKNITIGGDFTGNVSVATGGMSIKSMKVGGSFLAGSLDVLGSVGTLQTAGSLGSLGDTLTINGTVKKVMVGGDLRSNLRVTGDLNTLMVRGSIVDGGLPNGLLIDISGNLKSLVVGGDIQSGVTINAASIKKQKVGGQNAGTIVIQ